MSEWKKRTRVVAIAAVSCLIVVELLSASEDAPRERPAVDGPQEQAQRTARAESVRLDLLKREGHSEPARDLFASTTPPPPPLPPPPPPPPPPKPVAPMLPFQSMGKLEAQGEPTVFYLLEGDRVHAVLVGDTINGTYRVEAVERNTMELTYLPLGIKQTLSVGGES